jgi:Heterokaryon incompatibility protein (HET)
MTSFNYSSMPINSSKNEIRLVEILPCNHSPESIASVRHSSTQKHELPRSRVQCKLKLVSLNNSPVYTALSYAWGDKTDRGLVVVNGVEVSVTASLENALYHLSHASTIITLWVDALCVNQSDEREKNEQVP